MLRTRIRIKLLLSRILSILVISLILALAYLSGKLSETLVSIVCFYIFRFLFTKQYHAFTSIGCALVSVIVYLIIIKMELSLSESILYSVILTFLVNLTSFYVKDYKDDKLTIKLFENKFNQMKSKRLEELSESEMLRLFPSIKSDRIHIAYLYLHKEKGITANEFAYSFNISEPLLYKYVKQIKDAYKNLT